MAGFRCMIVIALCLSACQAFDVLYETVGNKTCRHTLKTEVMDKHCSTELRVVAAMIIVPHIHPFSVLPNCMNCSVTLVVPEDQQVVATLYKVETQTSSDGTCGLNRLDIYDGDNENSINRLSGKDGICGCKFPSGGEFKSSNNTMTLHFQTSCESMSTQHGVLELIITPVKNDMFNVTECNGQFECQNGECINKNLVCNDEYNCKDHSDETNCHIRNGTCPGQFECTNGSCIDKNLVCNGINNCPDGSDEKGCRKHENVTCPGKFECSDGKCIDKNKVCNGENDCPDKSDETGCHMNINRILLYVLLGFAGFIVLLLIVIVIVLCCKYCCISFRMASVYRRLS
ncbi:suppressor of tumorigenicity 14 protein-like [Mercenaria mercenaria]|uniref:suppressor of tumorigenicity 14 protein-like n=1 Tax=Mercenaria mercenaria TaxID=6596 RepID=UPI00234EC01D|nr:suppressor of tumorigenicity 14 protein-like [Mercenaria mercenaria]